MPLISVGTQCPQETIVSAASTASGEAQRPESGAACGAACGAPRVCVFILSFVLLLPSWLRPVPAGSRTLPRPGTDVLRFVKEESAGLTSSSDLEIVVNDINRGAGCEKWTKRAVGKLVHHSNPSKPDITVAAWDCDQCSDAWLYVPKSAQPKPTAQILEYIGTDAEDYELFAHTYFAGMVRSECEEAHCQIDCAGCGQTFEWGAEFYSCYKCADDPHLVELVGRDCFRKHQGIKRYTASRQLTMIVHDLVESLSCNGSWLWDTPVGPVNAPKVAQHALALGLKLDPKSVDDEGADAPTEFIMDLKLPAPAHYLLGRQPSRTSKTGFGKYRIDALGIECLDIHGKYLMITKLIDSTPEPDHFNIHTGGGMPGSHAEKNLSVVQLWNQEQLHLKEPNNNIVREGDFIVAIDNYSNAADFLRAINTEDKLRLTIHRGLPSDLLCKDRKPCQDDEGERRIVSLARFPLIGDRVRRTKRDHKYVAWAGWALLEDQCATVAATNLAKEEFQLTNPEGRVSMWLSFAGFEYLDEEVALERHLRALTSPRQLSAISELLMMSERAASLKAWLMGCTEKSRQQSRRIYRYPDRYSKEQLGAMNSCQQSATWSEVNSRCSLTLRTLQAVQRFGQRPGPTRYSIAAPQVAVQKVTKTTFLMYYSDHWVSENVAGDLEARFTLIGHTPRDTRLGEESLKALGFKATYSELVPDEKCGWIRDLNTICHTAYHGVQRAVAAQYGKDGLPRCKFQPVFCNPEHDEASRLGGTVQDIYDMEAGFLQGTCKSLDVGGSSRSDSDFAMVGKENQWIIKKVKPAEAESLDRIEGYAYRGHLLQGTPTLMLPFVMLFEEPLLTIMPNFQTEVVHLLQRLFPRQTGALMPKLEKYDVKPAQVKHSKERRPWIQRMIELNWSPANKDASQGEVDDMLWCPGHRADVASWNKGSGQVKPCWDQLRKILKDDLDWLDSVAETDFLGRKEDFVDFSLIFMLFTGPFEAHHVDVELPHYCLASARKGNTTVLCVRLIDYLMQKTLGRVFESIVKGGKFDSYGEATDELLDCSGRLWHRECRHYLELGSD